MSETKFYPVKSEPELEKWIDQVSNAIRAYSNYADNKFFKSVMLAIIETKNLMECMKTLPGQISVYNSLKYAASTGLSLNPQEGKAALVCYKNKDGFSVNYQIMKNGIIQLAMNSGKVEFVSSDIVRENDKFEIIKTMSGDEYKFIPALKARGQLVGCYAACRLNDNTTHVKWMTTEEIKEHRDQYSAMYKNKPDMSPWKKSFNGMGLKTVLKALFRNIYISDDISLAIGIDDNNESGNIINVTPGFSASDLNEKMEKTKKESPAKKEAEKKPPLKKNNGDLGF